MQKRQSGFSLIELLIVVAIILIIAAIAIPNLIRARISANESAAAQGVRMITTAEAQYNTAYGTSSQGFTTLPALGGSEPCAPSPTSSCILDQQMSSGMKEGYAFLVTPLNPTPNGAATDFIEGGAPESLSTGSRTFCASGDATIWATSPSGAIVPVPVTSNPCHTAPFSAVPGD